MKATYLFRPIWRMFDFKGVTGRAEYFTYTVTSCLFLAVLWLAGPFVTNVNWYVILPREVLNDNGMLPIDTEALYNVLMYGPYVTQIPMIALTVRRLRDQYANPLALGWLAVPFLGPVVLFGYGFVPAFTDYEVRQPDGTVVMRSEQLADLRLRNAIIGGCLVVLGVGAAASAMSSSVANLRIEGGRKTPVNPNASAFKKDGSINNRTSIFGHRRAHLRGFGSVSGSHNQYTL